MNASHCSDSSLSAPDADTLAVQEHGSALANLAFGSMSRTVITGPRKDATWPFCLTTPWNWI